MTTLTLTPPEPVAPVAPSASTGMVPLDPDALPALDERARAFVDRVVELDPHSAEFAATAESIRTMGDDDIRAAAEVSNRMLERPVKTLAKSGLGEGEKVSGSLVELLGDVDVLVQPLHRLPEVQLLLLERGVVEA